MLSFRALDSIFELEQVVDLEIAVWDLNPRDTVPASLLHASVLNGGVVIGAFAGEQLVGMAYAFPAQRDNKRLLWSHMTGVHPDHRGMGIGFGLKQAQRRWALERGYGLISWTFDPLQRGNANFNLRLLGATANVYHVDFYGQMTDGINAGLPSDRLEVRWDLRSKRVKMLAGISSPVSLVGDCPEEFFLLRTGAGNRPISCELAVDLETRWRFVEIPFDLGQLKRLDPSAALEWRLAVRQVLQQAFAQGCVLVDFVTVDNRCWYVLQLPQAWYLYVLVCSDDTLYTGVTPDLTRRVAQHNAGRGASYTASRLPVRLVGAWQFPGRSQALAAEGRFKRQPRRMKLKYLSDNLPFLDAPFVNAFESG